MTCRSCGVPISDGVIAGKFLHSPDNGREVLLSLHCPLWPFPLPARVFEPDEEDIPAIWRSDAHWDQVWRRSK